MTTTEIRTVAEIDATGTPYVGPALWGERRVMVGSERWRLSDGTECALTDAGILLPTALRAVDLLTILTRDLADARIALARVRDLAREEGAPRTAEAASSALPVRVAGEDS